MAGYNFEDNIQRGILYLIKNDRDFFVEARPLIREDYFDLNIHSRMFKYMGDYFDKYGKLPSDDLILEGLKETKQDNEFYGEFETELSYINALNRKSIEHKDAYMDLVEKFARNQRMKEAIIRSVECLERHDYDAIFEEVKSALRVRRDLDIGISFEDDELTRWDRFYGEHAQEGKFSVGFPSLDKPLEGGLSPKELGMVVANSGVGKSLFLVRLATKAAFKGLNVAYVSLEMSEDHIAGRIDTMVTKMPYRLIKTMKEQYIKRIAAARELMTGNIYIKQMPATQSTTGTIRAYLSQLQQKIDKKIDILIIDYLELLRPTIDGMAEYAAQQRITQELRGVAVENNLIVWTATQANRQGKTVPVITESELADSYGKIREVDYAYSINQTDTEKDDGKARLYVIKARNSLSRFQIEVKMDYNTLQIDEVDRADDSD